MLTKLYCLIRKKCVSFYFRVTSSEKVDKAKRYSEFCLCSVPYPGEKMMILLEIFLLFVCLFVCLFIEYTKFVILLG